MRNKKKVIVIDLDGTLTEFKKENQSYKDLRPNEAVVKQLNIYRSLGFYIIISTSRNMNTYNNNIGLINANTAPVVIEWLKKHDIPYDEIYFGKPWCGFEGFYVDDKSIRPSEFLKYTKEEIDIILNKEKTNNSDEK